MKKSGERRRCERDDEVCASVMRLSDGRLRVFPAKWS